MFRYRSRFFFDHFGKQVRTKQIFDFTVLIRCKHATQWGCGRMYLLSTVAFILARTNRMQMFAAETSVQHAIIGSIVMMTKIQVG